MKNKSDHLASFLKMEQARNLLDQGRCQESLVLALEALLQELDHLKDALLALQSENRPESSAALPSLKEEPPTPEPHWLPVVKTRVLH
jgi:hypothetical protein